MNRSKIKIVILAAGKGKRMGIDGPKVLETVKGKAMIKHLLESIKDSGVDTRPTIVVGHGKEHVIRELGEGYDYVVQEEQLGTGHAVMVTHEKLKDTAENVIVLYGDSPYVSAETIKKLAKQHLESGKKITMATIKLEDFEGWRGTVFYKNFSRIIRDEKGKIVRSVEVKDATEKELEILEVNPCFYCFEANWLWENLKKIKNENSQKEYYLNDLIKISTSEGIEIASIQIDAKEALAANSKAELDILENFIV